MRKLYLFLVIFLVILILFASFFLIPKNTNTANNNGDISSKFFEENFSPKISYKSCEIPYKNSGNLTSYEIGEYRFFSTSKFKYENIKISFSPYENSSFNFLNYAIDNEIEDYTEDVRDIGTFFCYEGFVFFHKNDGIFIEYKIEDEQDFYSIYAISQTIK